MLLWHEVKITVALPLGPKDTFKNGESQFYLILNQFLSSHNAFLKVANFFVFHAAFKWTKLNATWKKRIADSLDWTNDLSVWRQPCHHNVQSKFCYIWKVYWKPKKFAFKKDCFLVRPMETRWRLILSQSGLIRCKLKHRWQHLSHSINVSFCC